MKVQAFLKKWWVESDFKAPSLPCHYGSKFPAVTITVFITFHYGSKVPAVTITVFIQTKPINMKKYCVQINPPFITAQSFRLSL